MQNLCVGCINTAITSGTAFAGNLTVFSTSDIHGSIVGLNYFTSKPADVGLTKISTIIKEARSQNINKGKIPLQDLSGLYIYENYLYDIEINGAELRKYGDDGQMRSLMIRYVQEKGTIPPPATITGM